jgi:hypothetical protein
MTDVRRANELLQLIMDSVEELKKIMIANQNPSTGDGSFNEEKWRRLRDIVNQFSHIRFRSKKKR